MDTDIVLWLQRHRLLLLAGGASIGLLIAATSLFIDARRSADYLPAGAAAGVGARFITQKEYRAQIERLAADKRNPLTEADRVYALDRLIEEELLIQRGVEIGLTQSSPPVRKAIAAAMITQIVAEAAADEPTQAELRDLYAQNADFFSSPGRLHLRLIRIPLRNAPDSALQSARAAHRSLLAGEPFATVQKTWGDSSGLPLPDTPLPPMKVADYLGPSLTRAAMELEPGRFSKPIKSGSTYNILYVVARERPSTPQLADIVDQVAAEYRRQAGDRALREYLDWLRDRAHVVLQPGLTRF